MNIFAELKIAVAFKKVTYYTVLFEGNAHSEFEKFVLTHQGIKEIHNEYQDVMSLIKRLGNEIGAKQRYFTRNEKSAQALPPEWNKLFANERKLHVTYQHNLRLYCIRLSDEVVILFNGGVKTPGKITAQKCKVVRQYFYMANKLCQAIDEALRNKELKLNGLKLEIPKDFELIL